MHDADREKAKSIANNLVEPPPRVLKENPYLNKNPK